LQEKQVKPASEKKSKKSAEVEVEDGIIFPSLATHVPMRRRVPVFIEDTSSKPVANPVFVPQAGEMRNVVKFAPVAIIERPKEKNNKTEEEDMSSKTSPRLAFQESDDKKGISVEAKLRALYAIQLFDSRIDKIHAMRGELPLEVQDLEDDVTGLETRVERMSEEHKLFADDITNRKLGIKNAEALIKKYKEQLNNVKNNREFDSLNKEIEFQELEIQLHTKKIKESEGLATIKLETLEANKSKLEERKNDLKVKRKELDDIIASTEKEEKFLRKKSDEAKKKIEERLLAAYERIRSGSPNGMAVVPIEREASAGSFIQLPPQKQLDVASRRRVIVDEHSGRILVDSELAQEEQAAFDAMISSDLV
jgi:predicted  nucleic acid-binding Zn-ribbon protein